MPSRGVLFSLLALVIVNTKMIRSSLPPLVPFIAKDIGYSSIQQASLLGAFFPGYLLTQLPAGWLAQRFGAKLVLSLNMFGTAVLYSLLPTAARSSSGTLPVVGLLTTMGLCQGGLIPAEAAINRAWLAGMSPTGRAWMIRVLGFAHQLCHLIATCASHYVVTPPISVHPPVSATLNPPPPNSWRAGATPRLASRARGWVTVPAVYGCSAGAAAVLWHLFAKSHPDAPGSAAAPAAPGPAQTKEEPKRTTVEWAVFRTPAVLSIFACEIAYNNLTLTIETWAPTALASRFALTPIQVGSLLAAPQAIRTFGGFVVAALESVLLRRGVNVLSIRKWMTAAAQIPEAFCAVGYGLAKTPAAAAGFYSVLVAAGLFNCALSTTLCRAPTP